MFFTSRKQPIRCISIGQTAISMSVVRPFYSMLGAALLHQKSSGDAVIYAFLGGFLNGLCFGFLGSKISQDMETLDEPLPTFMLIQLCLAVAGVTSIPLGYFVTRNYKNEDAVQWMVMEQMLGEYALSVGLFFLGLSRMLLMRNAQEYLTLSQLIWRYWSFNLNDRVLCPTPPPLYVEANFVSNDSVVIEVVPITNTDESADLPKAQVI